MAAAASPLGCDAAHARLSQRPGVVPAHEEQEQYATLVELIGTTAAARVLGVCFLGFCFLCHECYPFWMSESVAGALAMGVGVMLYALLIEYLKAKQAACRDKHGRTLLQHACYLLGRLWARGYQVRQKALHRVVVEPGASQQPTGMAGFAVLAPRPPPAISRRSVVKFGILFPSTFCPAVSKVLHQRITAGDRPFRTL